MKYQAAEMPSGYALWVIATLANHYAEPKMLSKLLPIALLLSIYHGGALAASGVITKTVPACVTEDLFDEMVGYAVSGDRNGAIQLMASGQCTVLREGELVSVISPGFLHATIRYQGVKFITSSEALRLHR